MYPAWSTGLTLTHAPYVFSESAPTFSWRYWNHPSGCLLFGAVTPPWQWCSTRATAIAAQKKAYCLIALCGNRPRSSSCAVSEGA
jgi:hypothetical protein